MNIIEILMTISDNFVFQIFYIGFVFLFIIIYYFCSNSTIASETRPIILKPIIWLLEVLYTSHEILDYHPKKNTWTNFELELDYLQPCIPLLTLHHAVV